MLQVNADPSSQAVWEINDLTEVLISSNLKLEEV
jgi:hypothetical protein